MSRIHTSALDSFCAADISGEKCRVEAFLLPLLSGFTSKRLARSGNGVPPNVALELATHVIFDTAKRRNQIQTDLIQ